MRPVIDPELLLANFNPAFVRAIIQHVLHESHALEFKEFGKSDPYLFRLAIASFANSDGGFVLGGVADSKNVANPSLVEDRVKGIPDKYMEFGTWLDDVLADPLLVPGVVIEQKELILAGRRIGVVKVLPSRIGPVGVRKEVTSHLEFYKRGEQSKIKMTYPDIRNAFNVSKREHLQCSIPVLAQVLISINSLIKRGTESLGHEIYLHVFPSELLVRVSERLTVLLEGDANATRALFNLMHTLRAADAYLEALNSAARNNIQIANKDETVKTMLESLHRGSTNASEIIAALTIRYPESTGLLEGFLSVRLGENSNDISSSFASKRTAGNPSAA